jgi:hypothetical protein
MQFPPREFIDALHTSNHLERLLFCLAAGARNLIQCLNQSSWWDKGQCRPPDGLTIIASQFSPYLYPFTIEYSILVGESQCGETKCRRKYLDLAGINCLICITSGFE